MSHGSKFLLPLLLILWITPRFGYSETAVEQVGVALENLNRWLGDNDNARNWNKFLRSDDLIVQLALGSAADRNTVSAIHAIYSGQTSGLDRQRFVAVRTA